MKRPYQLQSTKPCLIWNIYGGDLTDDELNGADHIFVASKSHAESLRASTRSDKISELLQAFDRDRMSTNGNIVGGQLLFVGNNHNTAEIRRSVVLALDNAIEFDLYGAGWKRSGAAKYIRNQFLDNNLLAAHYRGAKAVLNDHSNNMGIDGYVSNRIFDVLACGTAVVTDKINGLPEDIKDWVHQYRSDEEFSDVVALACNETDARKKERIEFAEYMKQTHSFDQRATEIIAAARRAKPKKQITRKLVG